MAQIFLKVAINFVCVFMTSAFVLNDTCAGTENISQCDLQKSLIAIEGKMVEFVEQQYIIKKLSRKLELQGKEIHRLRKSFVLPNEERNWEMLPKAEPLVWHKDQENNVIGDASYSTAKFDHLLQQVQNLSSNLKTELENERRMRSLFQEEVRILLLNLTQPLISIHERLDKLERRVAENLSSDSTQKEDTRSTERRLQHLERELSLLRHSLNFSENIEEGREVKEVEEEKKYEEIDYCPPLDYKISPGLVIKVSPAVSRPGQTAYFSCSDDRTLVGDAFTRCRSDGTWSHGSFPLCLLPGQV